MLTPNHIVLIRPCCIGDVIMATPTLKALRNTYPQAHITWAVGSWSKRAIESHALLDDFLDTGDAANPARSVGGFWRLVRQLRAGRFDLAVSLVRSPLMSAAVWLSGIPQRAGLDSNGRGFGYNIRVPINPKDSRHEADIYLDVARALGADVTDCYANVTVQAEAVQFVNAFIQPPYIVVNPTGGSNPGMLMSSKRWPPQHYTALISALQQEVGIPTVLIGGPQDQPIIDAVLADLSIKPHTFVGTLSFDQIAALAHQATAYIGNDTGLTHLAAAAGAPTVMILGPSDPVRYAPFTPDSIALWKPTTISETGVSTGTPDDWNWERDGIGAESVIAQTLEFLRRRR